MFWSRSRQEVWRKGDTSGDRQWVREAAYYDCDGDALLFVVDQEGKGACHTGEHSCFFRRSAGRRGGRERMIRPTLSRDEFRALARDHTVVPVWRELLADLDDAGRRLRQAGRRRAGLPARVGRARRAVEPVLLRRPRPDGHARAARRPRRGRRRAARRRSRLDRGMLAALEALLHALPRRRRCPTCRRCTAAWSATSATTSCARSSACRTCRPTTAACPTRSCR